jgi:glycopeptide antibiotics resistance protein
VDINDVILNTLGVFVGYLLYVLARWVFTKKLKNQKAVAA